MVWPRRVSTVAAWSTAGLLAFSVALVAAAPSGPGLTNLAVGLAICPTSAVLGLVISRRQPDHRVGVLLTLVGLTAAVIVTREVSWQFLAGRPDTLASLAWLVAVLDQGADWVFVSVALLLLHFPDGRLPGPRWRWLPPTLIACAAVDQAVTAFAQEPFRPPLQHLPRPFGPLPAWAQAPGLVAFILMLALVLACAVSLIVRFRRSDPLRQDQIKWLALAGLGIPLYPLMCLIEIALWGRPLWLSAAVGVTALTGIPLATAVAMLRHDLYDVDKALAATVTYGLVTASLLAIYATISFAGGLILGRHSTVTAAGATAVCALALSPVKRRLHRAVDRRLYPSRRAALAAIDGLHLDTHAGRARPEELEQVLRAALREPTLRVGFRVPGGDGFIDTTGSPVDAAEAEDAEDAAPVALDGVQIGVITVDGAGASAELLREVARSCATLVEMVRLRLELADVVHEVESSRARLVQIGYEERRRLERDLHDGAQQRLVSLGMALRLAQRHLDDGTVEVHGLLDQAVAELGTAVAELRQIAHGLRPSLLDDGLGAALRALARTVPITIDLDITAALMPDDVATTAYFVASEALTNAVKHSAADRIGLQVARLDGHVIVRISDDGRGGARLSNDSGLADRVAALGGRLRVASPVGVGTVVEAVLPCAS
jgi:signal transduction histidine kinase